MRAEQWTPYFEGGDDTPRIVQGVAIVHIASDYALEFKPNGLPTRSTDAHGASAYARY